MIRRAFPLLLLAPLSCTLQRIQPAQSNAPDDHASHMSAADLREGATAPIASASQGTPGLPASAASATARLAASPRHGEWVKIPVGQGTSDTLMAWIVYPSTQTKAPVVVVVHEIFGLQTWVRAVADQVAADGFIAIAPDFLSRVRGGPSSEELAGDSVRKVIGGVDAAERSRIINAAASYAMTQPSADSRGWIVLPARAPAGTGDISTVVFVWRSVRNTETRSPTVPENTTQRPSEEMDGSLASPIVEETR